MERKLVRGVVNDLKFLREFAETTQSHSEPYMSVGVNGVELTLLDSYGCTSTGADAKIEGSVLKMLNEDSCTYISIEEIDTISLHFSGMDVDLYRIENCLLVAEMEEMK